MTCGCRLRCKATDFELHGTTCNTKQTTFHSFFLIHQYGSEHSCWLATNFSCSNFRPLGTVQTVCWGQSLKLSFWCPFSTIARGIFGSARFNERFAELTTPCSHEQRLCHLSQANAGKGSTDATSVVASTHNAPSKHIGRFAPSYCADLQTHVLSLRRGASEAYKKQKLQNAK